MRLVRLASDRAQIVQQLRSAIRPLLIGAWALTAVSVLLWIQPNWRPFAHALSVPSLLVVGMCVSFRTLE
jgi:hypothetical protein